MKLDFSWKKTGITFLTGAITGGFAAATQGGPLEHVSPFLAGIVTSFVLGALHVQVD